MPKSSYLNLVSLLLVFVVFPLVGNKSGLLVFICFVLIVCSVHKMFIDGSSRSFSNRYFFS